MGGNLGSLFLPEVLQGCGPPVLLTNREKIGAAQFYYNRAQKKYCCTYCVG